MKYLFTLTGWTCFSVPAKTRGREKLAKFTNYRFKTLSEKFYKVLLKLARNVCELLNFYRTQLKEVWKHGFTVLQAGHTICFWKLVCKLRYWLWPSETQYNINRCSAKTATKTSFKKLKMANWAALQLATFVFLKQHKKLPQIRLCFCSSDLFIYSLCWFSACILFLLSEYITVSEDPAFLVRVNKS